MRFSWHSISLKLLPIFGIIFGVISLSQKSNNQWLSPYITTSLYFLSLLCLIPLLSYSVYNVFKKLNIFSQAFISLLLLFLLALILDYIFDTHIFAKRKFIREDIFYVVLFISLLSIILIKFEHNITSLFSKILSIFDKRIIAFCLIFISVVPFAYNFLYNLYLDPYELFIKRDRGVYGDSGFLITLERIYHGGYDAIIVGSSHEIGIKNEIFDKVLGEKYNFTHSVTLDAPGITDHTQIRFINMALKANPSTKFVYFGYYEPGYGEPDDYIGSAADKEYYGYLYDNHRFNDLKFFYENSVKQVKSMLNGNRYSSYVVQDNWFPIFYNNFNRPLSTIVNGAGCTDVNKCFLYENLNLTSKLSDLDETFISRYVSELNDTLTKYKNVKFVFYSTLWRSSSAMYNSKNYRYNLIKRILMLGHKNIEIFMPSFDFILASPDLFIDSFHQHPYVHTLYLNDLKNNNHIIKDVNDLDNYYNWLNKEKEKLREQLPDRWLYSKFENYYESKAPIFKNNLVTIWNLPDDNNMFIRIINCNSVNRGDYSFGMESKSNVTEEFQQYRNYGTLMFTNSLSNTFTKGDNCYIEQGLPYKDWTEHYTATSVRLNLKYHDMYLLKDVVLNLTPTKWRPPAPIQEIIDKKEDYIVLQSDFDKYLIKK